MTSRPEKTQPATSAAYRYIHENAALSSKKTIHSGHLHRRITIALPAILHLQISSRAHLPEPQPQWEGEDQATTRCKFEMNGCPCPRECKAAPIRSIQSCLVRAVSPHHPSRLKSRTRAARPVVRPPGHEDKEGVCREQRDGRLTCLPSGLLCHRAAASSHPLGWGWGGSKAAQATADARSSR